MVKSKFLLVMIFLILSISSFGQINRYMVFFKDKNASPYSISAPENFLSQRAIDRRTKQNIDVVEGDLPVNETYVQGVKNTGVEIFFRTRWMNGLLVQCDQSKLTDIKALPYVDHVELVGHNQQLINAGRKKFSTKLRASKVNDVNLAQLHQIGIDQMQSEDIHGEGITIAIFDAGFPGVDVALPFQHIFNQGHVLQTQDFAYNTDNVYQYDEHGTEVLSVIAAYQDGVYHGGAYKANYLLYVTEDVPTEYRIEEYNWLFAAERADSAGADVINSSLGYYDFDDNSMNYSKAQMDGKTAVVTRAAQMLADRGVVVVVAAGNEGALSWHIITAPADAVDVLTVGNVDGSGTRSNSSSTGPSADGRIKPDVDAWGVGTSVIRPSGNVGSASGTSLATPLITSLVAGVIQKYPALTNKEVMTVIRKSASQASRPDNFLGFGIPNFNKIETYVKTLEENPFSIFPNPFIDSIVISPFMPANVGASQLHLTSSDGRVVWQGDYTFSKENPSAAIRSLQSLATGIYLLRIQWAAKSATFRVMKQR